MHSAYEELLSFNDIDQAVDKLFRAYLDLKLLELAGNPPDDGEYWRGVLEFRKQRLDPFTLSRGQRMLEATELEQARRAFQERRELFERSRAFLYWFDVRADFWANNRPDRDMPELAAADALEQLHSDVRALQGRLQVAERLARDRVTASSRATAATGERRQRPLRGTADRRSRNPLLDAVMSALGQENGRKGPSDAP